METQKENHTGTIYISSYNPRSLNKHIIQSRRNSSRPHSIRISRTPCYLNRMCFIIVSSRVLLVLGRKRGANPKDN